MTTSEDIKRRRKALGKTQEWLARRVAELSKSGFTQQAYQRFEKTPQAKSSFLHYMIMALDEEERRQQIGTAVAEASIEYSSGRDKDDTQYEHMLIKRLTSLIVSGKLSSQDVALIWQLVERLAEK